MIDIQPSTVQRAQSGEESAKLAIIKEMRPIINKFKYSSRFPSGWKDDVEQTSIMAILIAIEKCDIFRTKKLNFAELAKQYIKMEVDKLYNTCINPINLPVKVFAEYKVAKVDTAITILSNGIKVQNIDVLLGMLPPNKQFREGFEEIEKNYE